MTSKEMIETAVKLLDTKKAEDIQVLDILKISSLGDYFIIASGSNTIHVKSLVSDLDKAFSEAGIEPRSIEGKDTGTWVLMDYLDVVVHIFSKETRDFYQLERLWGDAVSVDIDAFLTE